MTRTRLLIALIAVIAASCATSGAGDDTTRIAFIQDLSAPDADEHVQPALQAAELAVAMHAPEGVSVELVPFDIAEEPSTIEEIASDPSFVAAIVGPGADGSAVAEAGVPTVSASTAGSTPGSGTWRRFVAPIDVVANAIAAELAGSEPCVLSEEPPPDALAGLLTDRLGGPEAHLAPDEAASFVEVSGCDAVAWAGSPDGAAELSQALPAGVALVGGDRLLNPDFANGGGAAAEGTRAVCACDDLATSTDPAVLRFIQDYQSEFGTAPGPYAVEAWDAAGEILRALVSGSSREGVEATVDALENLDGLRTTYLFEATGALAEPAGYVSVSELRAGRWVRLELST